jgi:hypothetical protein
MISSIIKAGDDYNRRWLFQLQVSWMKGGVFKDGKYQPGDDPPGWNYEGFNRFEGI